MARATALHAVGQRFESVILHKLMENNPKPIPPGCKIRGRMYQGFGVSPLQGESGRFDSVRLHKIVVSRSVTSSFTRLVQVRILRPAQIFMPV